MRAQAGVETEKEREEVRLQGRGEVGKTDFVEEVRSLEQAGGLDSRKEDRLTKRLSSWHVHVGEHRFSSSKPGSDILKLKI